MGRGTKRGIQQGKGRMGVEGEEEEEEEGEGEGEERGGRDGEGIRILDPSNSKGKMPPGQPIGTTRMPPNLTSRLLLEVVLYMLR